MSDQKKIAKLLSRLADAAADGTPDDALLDEIDALVPEIDASADKLEEALAVRWHALRPLVVGRHERRIADGGDAAVMAKTWGRQGAAHRAGAGDEAVLSKTWGRNEPHVKGDGAVLNKTWGRNEPHVKGDAAVVAKTWGRQDAHVKGDAAVMAKTWGRQGANVKDVRPDADAVEVVEAPDAAKLKRDK
jgi:hypothetical protein